MHRVAALKGRRCLIQIRGIEAVPKANVFQREHRLRPAVLHGGGFCFAGNGKFHRVRRALYPRLCGDNGRFCRKVHHRRHFDARRAAISQREMRRRHDKQLYRAVQAAVKRKIRLLRIDGIVIGIVHRDGECVLRAQVRRKINAERRKTALVPRQLFAVQKHLGRIGRAVYLEPNPVAVCQCGQFVPAQCARIAAGTAVIIVAAVLAVDGIPCVGQRNGLGGRIFCFKKCPALTKQNLLTHNNFSFTGDSRRRQSRPSKNWGALFVRPPLYFMQNARSNGRRAFWQSLIPRSPGRECGHSLLGDANDASAVSLVKITKFAVFDPFFAAG